MLTWEERQRNEDLERISNTIKRVVRAARNPKEAREAIERAGIPRITVTSVKPEGAFWLKVWYTTAGGAVRDVLCQCLAE